MPASNPARRPEILGPRVLLRAPLPVDVETRLALGNSPELHRMFGGDPDQVRPLTQDAAEAWVQAQAGDKLAWIIAHEGALIGNIRLHSVNYADLNARLAIGVLDESKLGQGLGSEAIRLLATHAFEEMGLHRLSLRVLSFNTRAIAAYAKVGFVEEGRERQSARIGGEWHDDVIMGLLATELRG